MVVVGGSMVYTRPMDNNWEPGVLNVSRALPTTQTPPTTGPSEHAGCMRAPRSDQSGETNGSSRAPTKHTITCGTGARHGVQSSARQATSHPGITQTTGKIRRLRICT